jgi:hypothetical protein
MTRWVPLLLSLVLVACAGRKNIDPIEPNQEASAGLVRVETGLPSADNAAAQAASRSERDLILRVLQTSQPAAQACYAKAIHRDPSLYGDLVARVDIGGDGTVSSAAIARTTLHDQEIGDCVVAALRVLQFPAPARDTLVVSYPYVFVSDLTPPEVVRALYIKYGFIDPDQEVTDDDKRKSMASGEEGWYESW